ncbi:MAG: M81 family metallopeptidase [Alphaproteobacteria bacterium]|nr:M81 family metallopeptidase [Alphaproteobacteria bacterium]
MRVLVGRIFHESHSFNPILTRHEDFAVTRGPKLLDEASGSTLSGIVGALRSAGAEPVATLSAMARPGGPIEHSVYADLKAEILDTARLEKVDAVAFELHGAMTTDRLHDAEGDFLSSLRDLVGPGIPIGAGLDLHAHVTEAMLRAADIVTACKHNPHSDVVEAGERTARLVLAALAGEIHPVTALVKLPMLLRGRLETDLPPLSDLHARARAWHAREPRLLDVSICNVHSYLDVPDLGQAVLAIADRDDDLAARAATDIAAEMWRRREDFVDALPGVDEAIDMVDAQPERRPWVLADRGDRVLAGAPGDSPEILRRLIECGSTLRSVTPVTDPASVAIARQEGVGATIRLDIGGKLTRGLSPLTLDVRVEALTDGRFVMRGPYQAGQPSSLGNTAIVTAGSHTVMLTSLSGLTQDPAAFTSQGIDLAAHDLVVAKSGYHFKLSFEGIATPLVVDTPGLTNWRPGFFPYRHARPFYPEDEIVPDGMSAALFRRQ